MHALGFNHKLPNVSEDSLANINGKKRDFKSVSKFIQEMSSFDKSSIMQNPNEAHNDVIDNDLLCYISKEKEKLTSIDI